MKTTNNKQQTTVWFYKTKYTLLLVLFTSLAIGQQKLTVEQAEQKVISYIEKKIPNYELTDEEITKIKNELLNCKEDINLTDEAFKAYLEVLKKERLRSEFFNLNPSFKDIYEAPLISNTNRQVCTNSGFENGNLNGLYTFTSRIAANTPLTGFSVNTQTRVLNQGIDPAFNFFIPSATIVNNFNQWATLVDQGNDPVIGGLPRVDNANRAIKLNASRSDGTFLGSNITTMSRAFVVNENTLRYRYSLVLEDEGHALANQPWFSVRIYDATNNRLIRQNNVVANRNDCLFSRIPVPGQNGTFYLFTNWVCDSIDTSDLIGQNIIVEFVIADCSFSQHFGTVYIDDICNVGCNPISGSINITNISSGTTNNNTIICPTSNITVCGNYILPQQSNYNNITLNVIQNGVTVGSITTPTILTATTFCFTVPISAFGSDPFGAFEFQVVGTFNRVCPQGNIVLNPIRDNSGYDFGDDVAFNNCIDAVDDFVSLTQCQTSQITILTNDTVFNNQATNSNTIITQTSAAIPELTLNTTTGEISVTPNSTIGTYSLTYQLCDANNPNSCDTATVTVTITPEAVSANHDNFVATTCSGGQTPSVLANDTFCGLALDFNTITVTLATNTIGATINDGSNGGVKGSINIPIGTPVGTYSLTYTVCINGSSTNLCSTSNVVIVVSIGALNTPTFSIVNAFCAGTTPPVLPTTSTNGISGTWSPSVVSNTSSGSYTFTPNTVCAAIVTYAITIIQQCGITISWGSEVSCQTADSGRKFEEDIADGPCLRVCENSTVTYTLHGSTAMIDHTIWNITGGIITSSTNTSCVITWTTANVCALQGIIYLNNGTQLYINRCIEKLEAPLAAFSVYPFASATSYTVCANSPTHFENHSFANDGDDNLYYNWYFGDGTSSNEFEPVHTYLHAGTYQVTLVVSNGCSCVSQVSGTVVVEEGILKIECAGVVCQGERSHYTIASQFGNCTDLTWQVTGGTILTYQNNNTSIEVLWDTVDQDGFGYVTVNSPSCSLCSSSVKVPVIKQSGSIKGDGIVCEKTQNLYTLPQWSSTYYHWSLDSNTTGAYLIVTNQRNEIMIQSQETGTLDLYCTYRNTLLGCGGTAHFTIQVQTTLGVSGSIESCAGTYGDYEITNNEGNLISNPSWTVTGPNSYVQQGNSNPANVFFPSTGIYYITTSDATHCESAPFKVTVFPRPSSPTSITGPTVVCTGIGYTYSCNPPPGYIAHWSVPTGSIIVGSNTGSSVLVAFNGASPYVLELTYEKNGCYSAPYLISITRDLPSQAPLPPTTVCGSTYADYASTISNADYYKWSIVPNTAGSIESGQNTTNIHVLWNQQPQTATVKLIIGKCGGTYAFTIAVVTIINAPTVTISSPSTICSDTNTNFDFSMTPTGTFTSVNWDLGDGTVITNLYPNSGITHRYLTPTDGSVNYTISATIVGGSGCIMDAVGTKNITVYPTPLLAITPANNLNLCGTSNTLADYTYSVTMQGGFAATDLIIWYHNNNPIQSGSGPNAATINLQSMGLAAVGTYYATVSNGTCTGRTQSFTVTNICSCSAPEIVDATITDLGCQSVSAQVTDLPVGYTDAVWETTLPGATILTSNTTTFVANNIAPGEYPLDFVATYNYNGQNCTTRKNLSFIVPYKADLKYKISCGSGYYYTVTLLDYSSYYANTPITHYYFSINGGGSWQQGTLVNGVYQSTFSLPQGNYQLAIKVLRSGSTAADSYDPCVKSLPLYLPAKPNASFTVSPNPVCMDGPVYLTPTNPQVGNHYLWSFFDNSTNLQPNPVKTFSTGGTKPISLTATDANGCASPTVTKIVEIKNNNMAGTLTVTPATTCQGGTELITYAPNQGTITPSQYIWHQNTVGNVPFATTNSPNLTVSQTGYYFVYLKDNFGCMKYDAGFANANFIPMPDTPIVTGSGIACVNSLIVLNVPVNPNVSYQWKRNGVLQPQWNNHYTITDYVDIAGSYTYSVVAISTTGNCSSLPGNLVVRVIDNPTMPILSMGMVSCSPYEVAVEVTNPQANVGYYWSNGDVGTSTVSTHDGPLQVRAVIDECAVKTQLDLPVDLESLSWIFPKGCYRFCGEPEGEIIGPLDEFQPWEWQENNGTVESGLGDMQPLHPLNNNGSYSMSLNNSYCELTTGTAEIRSERCKTCEFRFNIINVRCGQFNNQTIYQATITMINPENVTNWVTFTAPNGEGYFSNATFSIPPGSSEQTLIFTGQQGFTGGLVEVLVNSEFTGKTCLQYFEIVFPDNCQSLENCEFQYQFDTINCVKTLQGYIYVIPINIYNPYGLTASTSITVNPSDGNIVPGSVTSPNGFTNAIFYFYPSTTFVYDGHLDITVTSSIATVACTQNFILDIRNECPAVQNCNLGVTINSLNCEELANGQYGYNIDFNINNPYNWAMIYSLVAPGGEGYFVPNMLTLSAGQANYSVVFYPTNGFQGGYVNVQSEGHYDDQICISD